MRGKEEDDGPRDRMCRDCAGSPRAASTTTLSFSSSARFPYLFAWPLLGPLERHERVARRRADGRPYLEEILDAEATAPQQAHPIAVREVKLDARIVRPLDAMHTKCCAEQPIRGGNALLRRHAQCQQEGVGEKNELAARAKQA